METDGTTATQLTDEPLGVEDFSVSPVNGSLAIITADQLLIIDPMSKNRRLIAKSLAGNLDSFPLTVSSPVFSPDGQTLAYALGGLRLFHVASREDELVLTDGGNLLGESFIFSKENYAPGPWSPDSDKLLIIMGYFEGSTLGVMEPGKDQPFRRLRSTDPVCCTYNWTPDGKSVLVANPWFSTAWPGLWKYDAETGEEFKLVSTLPGQSRFVGWPVQLPSGDLRYFYGEKFTPENGIPLVMVQSSPDGGNRTQLRSEEFRIDQALWAEDGSLVLIHTCIASQNPESNNTQLMLVRPDGSPLQVLLEVKDIQQLQWGP